MSDLVPITGLLSYRISRVSNALSRGAALRYRREFDVSLGEWRTLALLGARAAWPGAACPPRRIG